MSGGVSAVVFLVLFVVGWVVGARFARAGQRIDVLLAAHRRDDDVCAAADDVAADRVERPEAVFRDRVVPVRNSHVSDVPVGHEDLAAHITTSLRAAAGIPFTSCVGLADTTASDLLADFRVTKK